MIVKHVAMFWVWSVAGFSGRGDLKLKPQDRTSPGDKSLNPGLEFVIVKRLYVLSLWNRWDVFVVKRE